MEILQQYNNKLEHYRHLFSELEIIKARMRDADEDRKKFIYDWVSKKHPSWLNEHHFDYRGLIAKGLAIEAPKDMYAQ